MNLKAGSAANARGPQIDVIVAALVIVVNDD
jgi:hypothetical protein